MKLQLNWWIQFFAALGSGVVAGVFFAFSSFVMPALARLPAPLGVAAMQSINVVVLNRSFLGVFLGTLACSALLGWRVLCGPASSGGRWALAGSLLYLLGCVLVTRAGNVPDNDALSRLSPSSEEAAVFWQRYVTRWSWWNHVRGLAAFAASLSFILSLSGCRQLGGCAAPDRSRLAALPSKLSQTGREDATVREFRPRFELWTDGAVKRRFVALPPGSRIDSADMDDWSFPVGTRLWKELVVGGVRVETRLLQKTGPGPEDWAAQAYVWLPDGSDALAAPSGADNALGTGHDVPASGQCWACHGGRRSFVLGFSALQLPREGEPGRWGLAELVAEGRLTHAPPDVLEVPGDATARAALGYLHANCAHCHNQRRPEAAGQRCHDPANGLDFSLRSAELGAVKRTASFLTSRGAEGRLLELMSTRGPFQQMPPLGTEQVDRAGVSAVRAWLANSR